MIVAGFAPPKKPPVIPAVDPVGYKAVKALRAKQALNAKLNAAKGKLLAKGGKLPVAKGKLPVAQGKLPVAKGKLPVAKGGEGVPEAKQVPDKNAAAAGGAGAVLAGQAGEGKDVATSTWVSSVLFLGCTVAEADGPDGCPSMDNPTPWNKPISFLELRVYNSWHYKQLLSATTWVLLGN